VDKRHLLKRRGKKRLFPTRKENVFSKARRERVPGSRAGKRKGRESKAKARPKAASAREGWGTWEGWKRTKGTRKERVSMNKGGGGAVKTNEQES